MWHSHINIRQNRQKAKSESLHNDKSFKSSETMVIKTCLPQITKQKQNYKENQ